MQKEVTVIEGNKLIADSPFSGLTKFDITDKSTNANFQGWVSGDKKQFSESQLNYHTSWDWIMPVIEKIWKFNCETNHTDSIYNLLDIFDMRIWAKIEEVYSAVIEFIDWYNTQQQ